MSRSRNPPQKGQGAARAKQMGLLLDLSPDAGLDDSGGNEAELEAELLALMGGGKGGGGRGGKKDGGKVPVPMEDIERMAAMCMKDLDEDGDDDADLEDDADLLAELNEVLEDGQEEPAPAPTPPRSTNATPKSTPATPSGGGGGLESLLQERIDMYQTAIANANASGEASKARRYDRGLKTLQTMLTSAKKGKPVNEEEIPPPVATGAKPAPAPIRQQEQAHTPPAMTNEKPLQEAKPVAPPKPQLLQPPNQKTPAVTPDTPAISPLTPVQPNPQHSELKASVLSRQREYKLAAIQAKQSGNTDLARQHLVVSKKFDSLIEAIDRGERVDASSLPPPPGRVVVERSPPAPQPTATKPTPARPPADAPAPDAPLPAPRNLAEALQQRLEKYKSAAETAKSKGDDRKARMHQRIAKQYQDAIKAHKAGRPVNLSELPVPPGCPPLQGAESTEQNFLGVLETAVKLANQDADAVEDDETDEDVSKPAVRPPAQRARAPAPAHSSSSSSSPAVTPTASSDTPRLGAKAQQQLDFLLRRRQQFVKAALRSKQMKDVQGAAQHLRNAKGLDPMITAAKGGLPVDISKVPSVPVSEEDYSLPNARSSSVSSRSSQQYAQLMERLKQQHEKCLSYLQQFTQVGNLVETIRFEKLADECMSDIELLKKAYAKGCPVPGHHTEERTINTVMIFSSLTASEMELTIVKGINLPTPGFSANDLDASVRFEFPFPSLEEAQRDKTNTVKSTNCPEFREKFKLHINRTHRGFKRVIQTKGIKFEIIHKGGLFKNDRIVGNAQMKLEGLENQCEIREIIDVLDGRKATGGKLDVRVRVREPLGGVQLQSVTEKWIVVDPPAITPDRERARERAPSPKSKPRNDHGKSHVQPSHSPPQYKLHSFSLLNYDKERVEKKIGEYKKNRRDPPPDLLNQHKEVCHRLHWQKSYLERGSSAMLAEYESVLNKFKCALAESVKKFSSEGNREAAKDALGRLKMVEAEMEALRRKRAA
ncbi:coiled-coil and C2 domain-containing protein 1A [Clarias gariepinus]|uniref:coiled-coil and C2 domain-containing protein 1A n=1 Tax=Clarias gariepinus TaxID=13013 RepID=UPI00234DCBCA|nr:coiled-coil and C2 domain-containing protein 1A [Clarias gariepinus]